MDAKKKKTQKQQIPWYARPFASYIKKETLPDGSHKLTYSISNVTVNHYLLPVYFFVSVFCLYHFFKVPLKGRGEEMGALSLSSWSCLFYYWSSMFFQPDLDVAVNRPGMNTFPFNMKSNLRKLPVLNIFHVLMTPIRVGWYIIWEPIAIMFTHRGALHWPIIGAWIRVAWLFLIYKSIMVLFYILKINPHHYFAVFEYWALAFFPWRPEFGGKIFFLFCFPVYISDIFHSSVDFFESRSKGSPFCSPIHRRGLLIRMAFAIKDMPKETLGHIKRFTSSD